MIELFAKLQGGGSPGAVRTQAKLMLKLAPMAKGGVEGDMLGELAGAMSDFLDGGKTLSIVMAPETPIPVSELSSLSNNDFTFSQLGFSAKAE